MKITDLSTPVFGGGKSGGGASKQIILLSVTTAPTGIFEKGSQYYNSSDKKIYTAVVDNSWENAKVENPQFGVIYIFDNQGITEYYQWDGDNLVETDLEKYQLIANKTDDFTESSKNKYPSSFALFKGLAGVRPNKVNNSGASLPVDLSDYSLGDTFLNITNKKLYTAKADAYELNTKVTNTATIDFQTGIASGFGGYNYYSFYNVMKTNTILGKWEGTKNHRIHFKLNSVPNDDVKYGFVNFSSHLTSNPYTSKQVGFYIKNKKIYIKSHYSQQGSNYDVENILALDFELSANIEYYLKIDKYSNTCSVQLYSGGYDGLLLASNEFEFNDYFVNGQFDLVYGSCPLDGYSDWHVYFSIGQIYLLDSTGDFLKASGTLVWNDGEDLTDLAQYADITNGILYFYADGILFGGEEASIKTTWFSSCSISNSSSTTATNIAVDSSKFIQQQSTDGNYTFSFDGSDWSLNGNVVDLNDFGISFEGTPTSGDTIKIVLASIAGNSLSTGISSISSVLKNGVELRPLVDYRINNGTITFTQALVITDEIGVK